ncbi:MAG: LysM peptidoglycan-binding domain-containing protein [Deltaproteobacteria bacterium]|jgi:hypothetical protein|nr:LysM peptidoglycan-binding domain-containing protein [Deltaproteobacteria bacterium]
MIKKPVMILAILSLLTVLAFWQAAMGLAQDGQITQSYVVEKGDTANSIAKKFYGKQSLGPSLWRANRNLVAHPKRLTAGDTIYIFPESTLALKRPIEVPSGPESPPVELYQREDLAIKSLPKSFTFISDFNSGIPTRLRIKFRDRKTEEIIDQYYEIRIVGEIISSNEVGGSLSDHQELIHARSGRTLLSTGDRVNIRFTEDLNKILDSDTYDEDDPYFRSFPVYAPAHRIDSSNPSNPDYRQDLGTLYFYKGNIKVYTRTEGTDLPRNLTSNRLKNSTKEKDLVHYDPVTYSAEVTYSESPILIHDKVLIFIPISPGPERRLDPPYVEDAGTFVSPGH